MDKEYKNQYIDSDISLADLVKAAQDGDPKAQGALARAYLDGTNGAEQDFEEAFHWANLAAKQGDACGQNCLGLIYARGDGADKDIDKALYWYTKAAEGGLVNAQCNLGSVYLLSKNEADKGYYWLTKAAEGGFAHAQELLGQCYNQGLGIPKDIDKALHWFKKAAEAGLPLSQRAMAIYYHNGIGVEQDMKEAFRWYSEAAKNGDTHSQWELAYFYQEGIGCKVDTDKALLWMTKAAENGNAEAQLELALYYVRGEIVERDMDTAFYWFTQAAEAGHKGAQYNLALCYKNGDGTPRDLNKSLYWASKAGEQGLEQAKDLMDRLKSEIRNGDDVQDGQSESSHSNLDLIIAEAQNGEKKAQYILGMEYLCGDNLDQDMDKAFHWLKLAAEQGHIDAQHILGMMYANGDGTEVDNAKAMKWITKAAEGGLDAAQYSLGSRYYQGDIVEQDYKKAFYWYKKAAEQGHMKAQCNLGDMYLNGKGVDEDYEVALYWLRKAADQGDELAINGLQQLGIFGKPNDNFDYEDEAEETFEVNGVEFKMIRVGGGTFDMGTDNPEVFEDGATTHDAPLHEVTVDTFYIGETMVTEELWTAVMNSSKLDSDPDAPISVSWYDAQKFAQRLSKLTGRNFRLPTEAEWEFAARGGNESIGFIYSGSDDIDDVAWYEGNSDDSLHDVSELEANELGICDMSGNLFEWCQDWFGEDYYQISPTENPKGLETGTEKSARGGHYAAPDYYSLVALRVSFKPECDNMVGIRLVMECDVHVESDEFDDYDEYEEYEDADEIDDDAREHYEQYRQKVVDGVANLSSDAKGRLTTILDYVKNSYAEIDDADLAIFLEVIGIDFKDMVPDDGVRFGEACMKLSELPYNQRIDVLRCVTFFINVNADLNFAFESGSLPAMASLLGLDPKKAFEEVF